MTATTAIPSAPPPSDLSKSRVTFTNVMASEWTKLRSVRSTFWTVLSLFVVTVGLGMLISWGVASSYDQLSSADKATFDPTSISLSGLMFGQLAIAVLGAMVISVEYSTGGIRTTLTAVPQRLKLLGAKAVVFFLLALVTGLVVSFASFFVGQFFLGRENISAGIGDPDVLRAVIGGGLYLAGSGMFGFALGALLRSTAGGITLAVAALVVLPIIAATLPGSWGNAIERYFTSNAGSQITSINATGNVLSPWAGYLVFTVWWVVILAIAAVLLKRRDA